MFWQKYHHQGQGLSLPLFVYIRHHHAFGLTRAENGIFHKNTKQQCFVMVALNWDNHSIGLVILQSVESSWDWLVFKINLQDFRDEKFSSPTALQVYLQISIGTASFGNLEFSFLSLVILPEMNNSLRSMNFGHWSTAHTAKSISTCMIFYPSSERCGWIWMHPIISYFLISSSSNYYFYYI